MDPQVALEMMFDPDRSRKERVDSADDLLGWLGHGGFAPKDGLGEVWSYGKVVDYRKALVGTIFAVAGLFLC